MIAIDDETRLVEAAMAAYGRARILVFDKLAAGTTVDVARLDLAQRLTLAQLERAENAVKE